MLAVIMSKITVLAHTVTVRPRPPRERVLGCRRQCRAVIPVPSGGGYGASAGEAIKKGMHWGLPGGILRHEHTTGHDSAAR